MNGSWSELGQTRAMGVSWSVASNPTRQDAWQPKSRDGGGGDRQVEGIRGSPLPLLRLGGGGPTLECLGLGRVLT